MAFNKNTSRPTPQKRRATTHHGASRPDAASAAPTKTQRKQEVKKKLSKGGKIALVAVGCAAMLLSVTAMACSGVINQATEEKTDYELTGGVAATVNGTNIKEDTITKQIMSLRESSDDYKDDAAWASYLAGQGLTPEDYRTNLINAYARQYLITQAEKEYDASVSQEEIDKAYDEAAQGYGGKESFEEVLSQMGYTEETYREGLQSQLALEKLKEAVAPEKDPSDDDIIAYMNENLSTYNDARRSSHILIKVDEDASEDEDAKAKEKAQEALDKINSGEMSFKDAAKEYSDDSSKDDGGDVGWDKLTTFVTEYQDALNGLSKGQTSGLVKSQYGYHIITCTDYFHADGAITAVDQIPSDLKDEIVSRIKTQQVSADYTEWLNDYVEKADIKINKMPEDVPYNVDMSKASSADADEGSNSEK